jgi:response regulator RpfG family c-di-GMP phosphodiesterase
MKDTTQMEHNEERKQMANILIVDDEEQMCRMLGRILTTHGYTCSLAANGIEARQHLTEQTFDLALCDVTMPGESGIDLARHITAHYEDTAIIMVTAVDDPNVADTAIESGTYGYILKPFDPNELIINIHNVLRRRKLEIENRMYRQELEGIVEERTIGLKRALEGIIQTMARTVEARDPYTAGHQERVARLAFAIATEMNLPKDQAVGIRMAGMIHDLGKISIPSEILSKPTMLSDIEFALIKTHSMNGYEILADIDFPWPVARIVQQHHERINGSGYPLGLTGENILLEARVLCIADVVEAMASHRPYRPALGVDVALGEIEKNKGIFYDNTAVDVCLRMFRQEGFNIDGKD